MKLKTLKNLEEDSKDRLHQEPYIDPDILRREAINRIKYYQKEISDEKAKAIQHYKNWPKDMILMQLGRSWTREQVIAEIRNNGKDADRFLKSGLLTFKKDKEVYIDTTHIKTFDNRAKIEELKDFFNIKEEEIS